MKTINRILLIRLSSLGDVLLASPLISLLRQKHPSAKIDFLIFKEYSELIRYHPGINQVFEINKAAGLHGLNRIKNKLKNQNYDVILDVHNNFRSRWLTLGLTSMFSGSRVYRIKKQKFARFLLVKFKINLYRRLYGKIIPVWEKYVNTAASLGFSPENHNGKPDFYLPETVRVSADKILKRFNLLSSFITVAPGARHYTKRWPAENYASVINRIFRDTGLTALLVGGASDIETVQSILNKADKQAAISLAGEISLLETAAITKNSQLLLTNDSGLMHVGSAMDIPLVAIFGSTVEEFGFFPAGSNINIVQNETLYCRPCSHIGRSTCPERHFKCMEEISPEVVAESIKDLLGKKRKG
jgi:heptosyltransferase-2